MSQPMTEAQAERVAQRTEFPEAEDALDQFLFEQGYELAASRGFLEFITEQLEQLEPVTKLYGPEALRAVRNAAFTFRYAYDGLAAHLKDHLEEQEAIATLGASRFYHLRERAKRQRRVA